MPRACALTPNFFAFLLVFRMGERLCSLLLGLADPIPTQFRMRRAETRAKKRRERLHPLKRRESGI